MKLKLNVENELGELVKNDKLNFKTKFIKLDTSEVTDFLKLCLDEIKIRSTFVS
jgi:hypothetical protein